MSLKTVLTEELNDQIKEIHKLPVGSEESKTAINGAGVLLDKINDIEKLELEKTKLETIEVERIEVEKAKVLIDKKDKISRNRIAIGSAIGGAAVTVGMGLLAYVYEERGTISSKPGRSFVDKGLNFFFKK